MIEIMRIPDDDPIENREETRGLEPMQLEEITGSKNPKVTPPQIISLGEILNHPKIARTSGKTSVPNPLLDLITIYDDEESLEVSLVTPVPITKEKYLEKASTLGLNALVQSHP